MQIIAHVKGLLIYTEFSVLVGFDTVHHSNGFSRGGRGGRGGFRRGDGYNRRGGPPGERGNRRGRGGFSGPPRGGRGGGFGQQQVHLVCLATNINLLSYMNIISFVLVLFSHPIC